QYRHPSDEIDLNPHLVSNLDADANPLILSTIGSSPLSLCLRGGKGSGDRGGSVQIMQETPLHLEIAANSPQSGMLVMPDTYYPGWQATVDGQAAEIYRANLNFRGVYISAGKHTITM